MHSVKLIDIVQTFDLKVVREFGNLESTEIKVADVTRAGLQLISNFTDVEVSRIKLLGTMEIAYLNSLTGSECRASMDRLLATGSPCLILSHNHEPRKEIIESVEKYKIPLFQSSLATSDLSGSIAQYLKSKMASRISVHGVLVEVHGEGILILGESGVGKSETALDLVKRGHHLIADDLVEIRKISDTTLLGKAPEIVQYLIEIRGLGILDVRRLYGVSAVKELERIDFVVNLELWDQNKDYDRIGQSEEMTDILGVEIPSVTIPVRPGRNLSIIIEVAALNFRQKMMGYHTLRSLMERVYSKNPELDVTIRREHIVQFIADDPPDYSSKFVYTKDQLSNKQADSVTAGEDEQD